jgi:hypothetical protein
VECAPNRFSKVARCTRSLAYALLIALFCLSTQSSVEKQKDGPVFSAAAIHGFVAKPHKDYRSGYSKQLLFIAPSWDRGLVSDGYFSRIAEWTNLYYFQPIDSEVSRAPPRYL